MKSIVTGGAGFIGSHIVDRLIELGHDVIVIDNESSEVHENFYYNPSAKYYRLNICDYDNTRMLYDGVNYVFHCAAESRIQPSIINPVKTVETNVLGTATVLQCSREAGVDKLMYSSTSSAYGESDDLPLVESMQENCLNPYSVSKVAGEKLCTMYTKLFGLKTIIFRYFNVYGDREPVSGQYVPVVGLFLKQVKCGKPCTVVPPGTQSRDFVNVSDVVNANILAMEKEIENKFYGEVFNVGTGIDYSILELARMMSNDITFIEPRIGEMSKTLASRMKIWTVLGWKPKIDIKDYISNKLSI